MRSVIVFLFVFLLVVSGSGLAKDTLTTESILLSHPGADLWRDVRNREIANIGVSQIKGVDSQVLVNISGDQWGRFRVNVIVKIAASGLLAVILVLFGLYAFRGKIKIKDGYCGQMVLRFSDYQRVLHWLLAIVFLYLAASGLVLLFGRAFLIPVFGKEVFSLIASASKESHNLFGPIFTVSLFLMIFEFGSRNIYEEGDFSWLLKVGVAGKSKASAGFFNPGEKIWFWLLIIIGLVISISGLVLVLQNFNQGRIVMEISHLLHVLSALLLIAVSFGHIYMGSVGTEATAEGMKNGYVDLNWAKMHHDRWAQECIDNKTVISADEFRKVNYSVLNSEDVK